MDEFDLERERILEEGRRREARIFKKIRRQEAELKELAAAALTELRKDGGDAGLDARTAQRLREEFGRLVLVLSHPEDHGRGS